jgi:hypothetical protein
MSGLHYWVVSEIETMSPWAQVKVLDQLIDAYLGEKKLLTKYTPMLDQISHRVQREIRRRQLVLNVNGKNHELTARLLLLLLLPTWVRIARIVKRGKRGNLGKRRRRKRR